MNTLEDKIFNLISPVAKDLHYNIVYVKAIGSKNLTLQIAIEKSDDSNLSIDDCVSFSRSISVLLDVNDALSNAYTLEVTSAGIDRPLIRKEDFLRFSGKNVIIKTKILLNNTKTFKGKLLGIKEDFVEILSVSNEKILIDFNIIDKANLNMFKDSDANEGKNDKTKRK